MDTWEPRSATQQHPQTLSLSQWPGLRQTAPVSSTVCGCRLKFWLVKGVIIHGNSTWFFEDSNAWNFSVDHNTCGTQMLLFLQLRHGAAGKSMTKIALAMPSTCALLSHCQVVMWGTITHMQDCTVQCDPFEISTHTDGRCPIVNDIKGQGGNAPALWCRFTARKHNKVKIAGHLSSDML